MALVLALGACGGQGKKTKATGSGSGGGESVAEVAENCKGNVINGVCEPDRDPTPPKPEGVHKIASCDTGSGGGELIGSVRIKNTGAIPFVAEVPFKWLLGDGSEVEAETQRVKLADGQSQLVFFKLRSGLNTTLNFQDHPGYFRGKNCRSKTMIVG